MSNVDQLKGGLGGATWFDASTKKSATLAEITAWLLASPETRTHEQVSAIAALLPQFPKLREASRQQLCAIARQVTTARLSRGEPLTRLGEMAEGVHLLLVGAVGLTDAPTHAARRRSSSGAGGAPQEPREEDMLHRYGPGDCIGDEVLLCGVRWPCRAQVLSSEALLVYIPRSLFNETLASCLRAALDRKVDFLCSLPILSEVPRRTVERLAPVFFEASLLPKDLLCRQGDPADCMWALASGRCHIVVDPLYRPTTNRPPETDARRTTQVGAVQRGQLVGELSVFGPLRRCAATVRCATEVRLFSIRRPLFVRACTPLQVEEFRALAEAYSQQQGAAQSNGRGEMSRLSQVLRGHSLRDLRPPRRAQSLRGSEAVLSPSGSAPSAPSPPSLPPRPSTQPGGSRGTPVRGADAAAAVGSGGAGGGDDGHPVPQHQWVSVAVTDAKGGASGGGIDGGGEGGEEAESAPDQGSPQTNGKRKDVVLDLDADPDRSPWSAVTATAAANPLVRAAKKPPGKEPAPAADGADGASIAATAPMSLAAPVGAAQRLEAVPQGAPVDPRVLAGTYSEPIDLSKLGPAWTSVDLAWIWDETLSMPHSRSDSPAPSNAPTSIASGGGVGWRQPSKSAADRPLQPAPTTVAALPFGWGFTFLHPSAAGEAAAAPVTGPEAAAAGISGNDGGSARASTAPQVSLNGTAASAPAAIGSGVAALAVGFEPASGAPPHVACGDCAGPTGGSVGGGGGDGSFPCSRSSTADGSSRTECAKDLGGGNGAADGGNSLGQGSSAGGAALGPHAAAARPMRAASRLPLLDCSWNLGPCSVLRFASGPLNRPRTSSMPPTLTANGGMLSTAGSITTAISTGGPAAALASRATIAAVPVAQPPFSGAPSVDAAVAAAVAAAAAAAATSAAASATQYTITAIASPRQSANGRAVGSTDDNTPGAAAAWQPTAEAPSEAPHPEVDDPRVTGDTPGGDAVMLNASGTPEKEAEAVTREDVRQEEATDTEARRQQAEEDPPYAWTCDSPRAERTHSRSSDASAAPPGTPGPWSPADHVAEADVASVTVEGAGAGGDRPAWGAGRGGAGAAANRRGFGVRAVNHAWVSAPVAGAAERAPAAAAGRGRQAPDKVWQNMDSGPPKTALIQIRPAPSTSRKSLSSTNAPAQPVATTISAAFGARGRAHAPQSKSYAPTPATAAATATATAIAAAATAAAKAAAAASRRAHDAYPYTQRPRSPPTASRSPSPTNPSQPHQVQRQHLFLRGLHHSHPQHRLKRNASHRSRSASPDSIPSRGISPDPSSPPRSLEPTNVGEPAPPQASPPQLASDGVGSRSGRNHQAVMTPGDAPVSGSGRWLGSAVGSMQRIASGTAPAFGVSPESGDPGATSAIGGGGVGGLGVAREGIAGGSGGGDAGGGGAAGSDGGGARDVASPGSSSNGSGGGDGDGAGAGGVGLPAEPLLDANAVSQPPPAATHAVDGEQVPFGPAEPVLAPTAAASLSPRQRATMHSAALVPSLAPSRPRPTSPVPLSAGVSAHLRRGSVADGRASTNGLLPTTSAPIPLTHGSFYSSTPAVLPAAPAPLPALTLTRSDALPGYQTFRPRQTDSLMHVTNSATLRIPMHGAAVTVGGLQPTAAATAAAVAGRPYEQKHERFERRSVTAGGLHHAATSAAAAGDGDSHGNGGGAGSGAVSITVVGAPLPTRQRLLSTAAAAAAAMAAPPPALSVDPTSYMFLQYEESEDSVASHDDQDDEYAGQDSEDRPNGDDAVAVDAGTAAAEHDNGSDIRSAIVTDTGSIAYEGQPGVAGNVQSSGIQAARPSSALPSVPELHPQRQQSLRNDSSRPGSSRALGRQSQSLLQQAQRQQQEQREPERQQSSARSTPQPFLFRGDSLRMPWELPQQSASRLKPQVGEWIEAPPLHTWEVAPLPSADVAGAAAAGEPPGDAPSAAGSPVASPSTTTAGGYGQAAGAGNGTSTPGSPVSQRPQAHSRARSSGAFDRALPPVLLPPNPTVSRRASFEALRLSVAAANASPRASLYAPNQTHGRMQNPAQPTRSSLATVSESGGAGGGSSGGSVAESPTTTSRDVMATAAATLAAAAATPPQQPAAAASHSHTGSRGGPSPSSAAGAANSATANALATLLAKGAGRTVLPASAPQPTLILKGGFAFKIASGSRSRSGGSSGQLATHSISYGSAGLQALLSSPPPPSS